jgi:hypothetical protein
MSSEFTRIAEEVRQSLAAAPLFPGIFDLDVFLWPPFAPASSPRGLRWPPLPPNRERPCGIDALGKSCSIFEQLLPVLLH